MGGKMRQIKPQLRFRTIKQQINHRLKQHVFEQRRRQAGDTLFAQRFQRLAIVLWLMTFCVYLVHQEETNTDLGIGTGAVGRDPNSRNCAVEHLHLKVGPSAQNLKK